MLSFLWKNIWSDVFAELNMRLRQAAERKEYNNIEQARVHWDAYHSNSSSTGLAFMQQDEEHQKKDKNQKCINVFKKKWKRIE